MRAFVTGFGALLDQSLDESAIIADGRRLLADLIRDDTWLDPAFTKPHPQHYQQYLLHCDSSLRFCVVAFVWGPGQATPIHDHTVWGLVGVLRGMERVQSYVLEGPTPVATGPLQDLLPGDVETVSPRLGDIHQVSNGFSDQVSISIHVYGGNIGAIPRSAYHDGHVQEFVSGYANHYLPNIWDQAGS